MKMYVCLTDSIDLMQSTGDISRQGNPGLEFKSELERKAQLIIAFLGHDAGLGTNTASSGPPDVPFSVFNIAYYQVRAHCEAKLMPELLRRRHESGVEARRSLHDSQRQLHCGRLRGTH